jgi:hypothetical protein
MRGDLFHCPGDHPLNPKIFFATVAAAALTATVSNAVIIIPSTADIFLASQPTGTTITGYFGSDSAPANSPVEFSVGAGATVTEVATGSTSVDDFCFAGPDGGCYSDESSFSAAPASGTYKGPSNALIGVFLGAGVTDVSMGPASLDYTVAANTDLVSQSPALDQIFFLGDGLTSGNVTQQFIAPSGATRLFLAAADSYGSSTGNLGYLSVDITGATYVSGGGTVPEPATWALMGLGFGAAGALLRRKARGPVPAAV